MCQTYLILYFGHKYNKNDNCNYGSENLLPLNDQQSNQCFKLITHYNEHATV